MDRLQARRRRLRARKEAAALMAQCPPLPCGCRWEVMTPERDHFRSRPGSGFRRERAMGKGGVYRVLWVRRGCPVHWEEGE